MSTEDFIALVLAHKWVAVAAVIIGLVVRLLKSDTKIPWNVPARWRGWLALGLGVVAAALDKVAAGGSWTDASAFLLSGLIAIVGHQLGIEWLRGGKELPVPGLQKSTPPGDTVTRIVGGLCLFLVVSCTPAERAQLTVPVVSTIDAVGMQVAQVLVWCDKHGIDAQLLRDAQIAAADRDYRTALDLSRKILEKTAASGEPVPKELVAVIETTEGALAAEAVQDVARALAR